MRRYRLQFYLLAFGFFLLTTHKSSGQVAGGVHANLLKAYEKGWYEECLFKAEAMIQKDKYKKDPEPYLYMAMCFYELIRIPQQAEFYKNALRYSFKQAAKVRKLDKDSSFYHANVQFYQNLMIWGLEQAEKDIQRKKYRKAATKYGYILKIDPGNKNALYVKGVYDILAKNVSVGEINIQSALSDIRSGYSSDSITEPAAVEAVILYANQLFEESLADSVRADQLIESARTILATGTIMFPNSIMLQDGIVRTNRRIMGSGKVD
ncbi:MAG: hypothetical protein JKY52_14845 [Flavobacteriales bacterium]|nr:hypothetical protein [Flavobacteriales bacterium]